ncbi:MAG: hypothetical protein KIT84_03380 [Labilithrix sp.]|nr:hypothetical protein [Labilithrix sp.]MCW5810025.1 hypothetical protein [Labilithrix sp.]
MKRVFVFLVVAGVTACSLLAGAQQRKPGGAARPAASAASAASAEGGAPMAAKEGPEVAAKDAGALKGGAVLEQKTASDGGARVFRFGEVEVEGRLKSPQIVYFLRRVRAEFAAGDLGHRSFMRELGETKNEPSF